MQAQKQWLAIVIFILVSFKCRVGDGRLIVVNQKNSSDSCNSLQREGGGYCNSLQTVLHFVANSTKIGNGSSIVEVQVTEGSYELGDPVTIQQSIILRAKTPGTMVLVKLEEQNLTCNDSSVSCYGLLIKSAEHAAIEGITFEKSRGIITFENVSRVSISNSKFRYFENGALDMFMCIQVEVSHCTFEHNGPVTVFKQEQYRGSAAGISIGYDDNHYSDTGIPIESVPGGTGSVSVINCTFHNNTHTPITDQQVNTHNFFSRFVFPGRGGALSITVNSSFPFNANISDCLVENNLAQSFGGGFYIVYSGYSEHLTIVNNSMFANGHAGDGGGGALVVAFVEAGMGESFNVRLQVYNSNFTQNSAVFGGGIFFLAGRGTTTSGNLTNHIRMENCSFTGNKATEYGAAVCVSSLLFLIPTFNVPPIIIINSTFDDNDALGRGGVLSTAYVPIYFGGYINFRRNRGRSLAVIGTRVEVHGDILFYGNGGSGIDGGSVYLTSFAQLVLRAGAKIDFINNTGVLGAALVADYHIQSSVSKNYLQTIYNPLCPLRYYNDPRSKPDDWKDVNITFEGNEALVGSAVFLDGIHACAWTGQHSVSELDPSRAFRWDFIEFGVNTNTVHGDEENSLEWYVQTPAESIDIMKNNVTAFLGEDFDLDVYGLDELGRFTAVVLKLSDASDPSDITFVPETVVPGKVEDVSVHSRFLSHSGSYRILEKPRQTLISTLLTTNVIQEYFSIVPELCPAGYQLTNGSSGFECICNSEDDTRVANCRGRTILLTEALWGASFTSVNATSHSLATYPCPFHYCSCSVKGSACMYIYDEERPYEQCQCHRHGVLCGQCTNVEDGFSVLLNRCVNCTAFSILWLIGLVLADALVIGLFLTLKWAPLDWFYPALLHIQVVPLMTFYFPHTFEIIQPYVLYVSSALSFYYAYDLCVFPGLYAEYSYLMKFLPFSITIALCIVVAAHRYYYHLHHQPWYGLWWVILLQYTHLAHTAMSILHCPSLPDSAGNIASRWVVNGNIECFKNLHLVIALIAIVILALCISIIPVILIYSCGILEKPVILHKTLDELSSTFKEGYSWWPAMELFRRLILILFIVAFPGNDYPVMFYLATAVTVSTFMQPYKHAISNILDALLTADVLVLLLIRNTSAISFGEDQTFSLTEETGTKFNTTNLTCSVLPAEQSVTKRVYTLAPFYFIPLLVFILTIIALIIYSVWALIKKHQRSEVNEDVESDSYMYNTSNNPTTTCVEVSTRIESSSSGRFRFSKSNSRLKLKSRLYNTRYLRLGWTRRPGRESEQHKHKYFRRRKGQSLLETDQRPPSADNQHTKIVRTRPKAFKKTSIGAHNPLSLELPLDQDKVSNKITGKAKSLPRLPIKDDQGVVMAKTSATMKANRTSENSTDTQLLLPLLAYSDGHQFKHSGDQTVSRSNQNFCDTQF